jgi:hypothetical protein
MRFRRQRHLKRRARIDRVLEVSLFAHLGAHMGTECVSTEQGTRSSRPQAIALPDWRPFGLNGGLQMPAVGRLPAENFGLPW